jgi:archaemetzincin
LGQWSNNFEVTGRLPPDGKQDKSEIFEEFLKRRRHHAKEGQSLAFFSIGRLPQLVSLSELGDFVEAYFSLPVFFLQDREINSIPNVAWRSIPCYVPQANANSILDHILKPQKDPNAERCWGIIAITHEDLLYDPDDVLDYVYGLSGAGEPGKPGIAVVSTRRIWQPDAVGFELSRLRLFKLVTHEIGHLFHVQHCLKHACNMNGCETVDQIDRHPIEVCPDCMAKICWIGQIHPKARYDRLIAVCERLNMQTEAGLYRACRELL